jgi:predicted RND superfamily exporter protein
LNLFDAIAHLVTKQRPLTVGLLLLISGIALYGYLFPPPIQGGGTLRRITDADWNYLQSVEEDFRLREIDAFLVFSGDDLLSPDAVAVLRHSAQRVRELDYVEQIFWLDDVPVLNVFGLADPLLPPAGASAQSFLQAREKILHHPLIRGQLVATDAKTIVIPVFFQWINVQSDQQVTRDLLDEVREILRQHPDAGISVGLTGDVPLYVDQQTFNKKNQKKFQIIGYTLAFVVAALLFRGILPTLMVVSGAFIGMFWSFGALRIMHQNDNPLTNAILPVLLAMVGIADSIHLATFFRSSLQSGMTNRAAAMLTIREIGPACFLTSLTTAIGFGSLMLANSLFVQGFGKACAVGVMLTFLSVLTVFPLLASTWLGKWFILSERRDWVDSGLRRFRWFVDGLIRYKIQVSLFAIVLTALMSLSVFFLKPDAVISSALPASAQSVQTLEHTDRTMGGIQFARIVVEWDESIPADSPEILRVVQEVEALIDRQPLLSHPLSINSLLYTLPGDASDIDHRLALLDLLPRQLRNAFINRDTRRTLVNVRLQAIGIAAYRPVFAELRDEFTAMANAHPGFQVEISGETIVRSRRIYEIVTDLARSLGAASVIILIVMSLAYRSLRLGLISIIPNMFPLALTAFFLFLTDHPLDISTICAFTVCLGIAVDDTIHFLGWFRRSLAAGNSTEVAVRETFINVGKPLIFTTILMVTGFATILTSDLPDQQVFGAMACSTIGSALIGDMVFLPAFLAWLVPGKRGQRQ